MGKSISLKYASDAGYLGHLWPSIDMNVIIVLNNFDHHWIWLNSWIGEGNYTYFILYLIFLLAMMAFLLIYTTLELFMYRVDDSTVGENISHKVYLLFILPYALVVAIPVGLLLSFHIYLICLGETTHK